jgi:TRAP-type C4-dicarboxylate transport system substrate-binding protein
LLQSIREEIAVATELKLPATQEQADSQEVARLIAGGMKVSDPELRRRIRARAEKVRQEILEKHGVVEWAVDMIRDARDE